MIIAEEKIGDTHGWLYRLEVDMSDIALLRVRIMHLCLNVCVCIVFEVHGIHNSTVS